MNRIAVIALCLLASIAQARNPRGAPMGPFIGSCPVTVGPITVNATTPRSTGISPLLVFFDATGTTYSGTLQGANNPFQDLSYTWNFGDGGTSGTSTWAYGSNPGVNSRNTATGAIAAHLYVTSGADAPYTATITVTDGTNTAQCNVAVTAYDPSGSNGFPGAATICQAQTATPVPGSNGCPAGATPSTSASASTNVTSTMSGKRVLFNCGDTFTGGATAGGTKWSVGAYGACAGTSTGRPIMKSGWSLGASMVDGRISDLDWESSGSAISTATGADISQITVWNVNSTGNSTTFYTYDGTQQGAVQLTMHGMGTQQGVFLNNNENVCTNLNTTYQCGLGGSATYLDVRYMAVLGSYFDGVGGSGSNVETVRISACRMCTFTNSTYLNATTGAAVLKFHSGNGPNTSCEWLGQWTENIEMSDNYFGGTGGAELVEMVAQNQVTDERLQNIVIERNIFAPSSGSHQLLGGAMHMTVRDNVFNASAASLGNRGYQGSSNNTTGAICSGSGTTSAPILASYPQYDEFYNNTCYNGGCGSLGGSGLTAPANNSFAQNNLIYLASAVSNSGSGNVVGNNTTTTTNNPGFTNGSGLFDIISDFKPTAFYTLTNTPVPVFYDALGVTWSPTWDLGAVHH